MKKETLVASVLVLVMTLVLTSTAMAELPGGGWWSGAQVQNVGDTDATVQITAFGSSGTYSGDERTVDPGASTTYLPTDFTDMPDGFQGSAAVSSDQPIKTIVNVTNREVGDYGVTGGLASAQYQGIDGIQADTTVSFPLVKNGYYNKTTTFYIQNAGSSAASILATYQVAAGTYTKTYSIDSNQMVVVNPADAGVPDGETSLGALTVTSDQPVAGAVMEHPSAGGAAEQLQSTRGFVPADFCSTIYAPIVKRGFVDRHTGIQVQNVSDAAVDVYVTYYGVIGCTGEFSNSATGLAAGASYTFFDDENLPEGCLASAVITATGQIAGVVNETFYPTVPSGQAQAQVTYSCIPDSSATTEIAVPLYKNKFYNKTTGLQVQNVGDSLATVNLVFTDQNDNTYTLTITIPPKESRNFLEVDVSPQDGNWDTQPGSGYLLMGVMITSDQPVVAIANESVYPYDGSVLVQDKSNYEGFNLE